MEIKFFPSRKKKSGFVQDSPIHGFASSKGSAPGIHEIVEKVEGFRYPLKVVVAVEGDRMTVITNYPLKKGRTP